MVVLTLVSQSPRAPLIPKLCNLLQF
ncbi:hypothetical protein TorRG33x02_255000 [Trema orientale]|uniref:Uncharacterized protein n=1 Tax=Trema orientale TaxID=63057 RepID=A0A2P5DD38_TREOI|nr:hypothetical protein TorRG33x02_255000 [Trema orientale]